MTTEKTIGVLVVDDAESIRLSFHQLVDAFPDLLWLGESSDGRSVLVDCERLCPDGVLIDVALPHVSVAEITHQIGSRFPQIRVIGLVGFEDNSVTQPILQAGAVSCISKSADVLLIAETVRWAARDFMPGELPGAKAPG